MLDFLFRKRIKVEILNKNAILPTRGSKYSAGYDLYACLTKNVIVPAGKTVKIGTGLAFALPKRTFGAIFARSGLATKKGLAPANKVGVCDADYRGEYIIALHNDSDEDQIIEPGERIAQMILLPYISMLFMVGRLDKTERGNGGFGHSGNK